jgi:hypothetical protein
MSHLPWETDPEIDFSELCRLARETNRFQRFHGPAEEGTWYSYYDRPLLRAIWRIGSEHPPHDEPIDTQLWAELKHLLAGAIPQMHDAVRRLSYEYFEKRGRADGHDVEDWNRAFDVVARNIVCRAVARESSRRQADVVSWGGS